MKDDDSTKSMILGALQSPAIGARISVLLVAFVKSCQEEPLAPGPANAEGLVIVEAMELITVSQGRRLKLNRYIG